MNQDRIGRSFRDPEDVMLRPLFRSFACVATLALVTSPANAEEPDTALAFISGASVFLSGFAVGSVLLASSRSDRARDNAGWLTIESGFVMAPLVSHAVTSEWVRGAVFASAPAAMMAGTGTLFAIEPGTVRHGDLTEQRILWGLFGAALFSSAAGVVDATLADGRAKAFLVTPNVSATELGVQVEGTL